jgi:hypothetical protein
MPSSVWDPAYVAFAREKLGAPSMRCLGADAELLARLLFDHARLVSVQRLAWLFAGLEKPLAVRERDLADLQPGEVDAPQLLPALVAAGPSVEVLRSAAELERDSFVSLPPVEFDRDRLARELGRAIEVAPDLERLDVAVVRSLGFCGRVAAGEIWIGAPSEEHQGPSVSHLVWQASHEATVSELARLSSEFGERFEERELERAALVLLAERADEQGRSREHRAWFERFGASPPLRASLPAPSQALLSAACRRSGT